ncbi:hypothetical protein [Streptomyces sp. NBC_01092]|uniref:hypothetical protein n=1 Tax=Streptomyces sp. NBC_01092 TaxID=2903748 RepID=UPI0038704813|nr:hypothetical protein OG254_15665 [Streptomyces sp. NBC_01092]
MPANPELHIWLQPVKGEPLTVRTGDFATLDSAVVALNEALDDGRTLRFELTAPDDAENGFALINFAHVAAVKVWPGAGKGADGGQYL